MRIVGREVLVNFMSRHADSRKWIECWIAETEKIEWSHPQDIKKKYPTVSFLSDNRAIFNVKRQQLQAGLQNRVQNKNRKS